VKQFAMGSDEYLLFARVIIDMTAILITYTLASAWIVSGLILAARTAPVSPVSRH
jgi:hypothetical protein